MQNTASTALRHCVLAYAASNQGGNIEGYKHQKSHKAYRSASSEQCCNNCLLNNQPSHASCLLPPNLRPQAIAGVRGVALRALRMLPSSPPATFHVLRAALLLLGREPNSLKTWREASGQLGLKMFDEVAGFDAHADVGAALWKR